VAPVAALAALAAFPSLAAVSAVSAVSALAASATRAAVGAMLYWASAIRSQSRRSFDASVTRRSCSARSPRSSAANAPSASFGTTSTEAGNSGGIDLSVGGKVESKPIL